MEIPFEIYLALYQGISGTEEFRNIYREFSPDFFDLIVIDERHRGSAAEDRPGATTSTICRPLPRSG